ncbi:MAG: hypothetical protein K6T75_04750 [Acetobacteraceae bacterium]|nr:hypothetical protein [Acetobacteraceae bacterium]
MPRYRAFVTRRIPDSALSIVERAAEVRLWPCDDEPPPPEELRREAAEADALLCLLTDRIDGALLDAAPRLVVAANMAVGYDNIDVAAATARGVLVTNTPGGSPRPRPTWHLPCSWRRRAAWPRATPWCGRGSGGRGGRCCSWGGTCTGPRWA